MARTLADCLNEMRRGGDINDAEWRRINGAFEERRAQYRLSLGDDEAAARAAADLEADYTKAAFESRRRGALTVAAQSRLKETLQTFQHADGKPDVNEAAMREVQRIEHRKNAIVGMARSMISEILDRSRPLPVIGVRRNKALFDDVVRAAHGDGNVSPEAREFAAAQDQMFEWLRQRRNDAGGATGKLDNYFPHYNEPRALRSIGSEEWIKQIMPRLNPERSGMAMEGRPFTDAELRARLPRIFETITTEGWNTREPMMRPAGSGSMATRRSEARMLHFRSGDDWLAYNRDFGSGDAFDAMTHHVESMARDIAALEILGPNPDGMVHWMRQVVEQQGALATAGRPSLARGEATAAARAAVTNHRLDAMWSDIKGEAAAPVRLGLAEFMSTIRSFNVASKLGRALLSSVSDVATQKLARAYNEVGGNVLGDITGYLAKYPWSRDEAARAGLMMDSMLLVFHDRALNAKGWAIRGVADYFADRVLAVSGLSPWTHAGRHMFGFSFFGEVADQAGKTFDALPEHLRTAFERHGMNATDWNVIRSAEVYSGRVGMKAGFIRPTDVMAVTDGPALARVQQLLGLNDMDEAARLAAARQGSQETATKYLEMVLAETEYAVPTATARARTLLHADTRRGTVPGEIMRSISQFRSYPMVAGLLWGQRMANDLIRDQAGGSWHRALYGRGALYGTAALVSTTLLGGLAVQMKNIASGRDPENMNPATPEGRKFWMQALAQGGGLGILSDFVLADHNRFGNSLGATIMGPTAGVFEDVGKLTIGQLQTTNEEKETKFGKELIKFAARHLPGGNLWFSDLALDRLVFDNLQRMADPKAEDAFRRQVRTRQRERGQGFWWAPGENAPARAPDMSGAWRGRQ